MSAMQCVCVWLCVCALLITVTMVGEVRGLANCPPGCQCDDNTLVVQCGEGQLDVLPIALNPSIQRLVIRSNKIKTIDSSIQFYAELTYLDLSANHLMTIPQRTFAYQKKLREIHLNHNKIGQISNKTFIGLSAVTVLNLRGNQISELHQGTFAPLLKIEELNLGENRIGFIDPKAFDGLQQLRILYLDDNALTSVPDPVILQAMPTLAELYLGMNTLYTLPSAAFRDVKGLTRLDLRGAGLRNVSHDTFAGLEALRVLDLSDNRLSRIPTLSLSALERLEELSLGQNDFEVISEGAFVGLKQLKRLDINGAVRLKRIMNGAFASNANLEYLALSSNKMLAEVQEGALSGLPHLRHVILKANALTTLAEGLFPWRDLITLDLSDNNMACDCRIMWLRNLLVSRNSTTNTNNNSNSNGNGNNNNNDAMPDVVCEFPERLRGEQLRNLNPTLMGCTHADPRKQALIGALLVGSAATVTALALIIYRCRRKIREYLKGGLWGSSALGRKEREYQKTFCDEDYMSRHAHHPCSLGIHSTTFPNAYSHPSGHHYGLCGMPINDLSGNANGGGSGSGTAAHMGMGMGMGMPVGMGMGMANAGAGDFQQLQVPTGTLLGDKKSLKGMAAGDDSCSGSGSGSFVMHMKGGCMAGPPTTQKLNHYSKPQFLSATATAAVGDSCYSYADVPIVHAADKPTNDARHHHHHQPLRACAPQQLRLSQEHFLQQQQQQQHHPHHQHHFQLEQQQQQQQQQQYGSASSYSDNMDALSDSMDPNYIYSNAHYSLPLEQVDRSKTPTPPPLPPALPLRNGVGRGSYTAKPKKHHASIATATTTGSGSGSGSGSGNSSGSTASSILHTFH